MVLVFAGWGFPPDPWVAMVPLWLFNMFGGSGANGPAEMSPYTQNSGAWHQVPGKERLHAT